MDDGVQHHQPPERCAPRGHRHQPATDRPARQLHEPRLARRDDRARPDEPARQRGGDVLQLCPRRPFAPGADQGQLLGWTRGARRRALPGSQRLFPARRGLSRAVLWPARARAARQVGASPASGASAICDDGCSAGGVQRQAPCPGGAAAGAAGPLDRGSPVHQGARRIARQRFRAQPCRRTRAADQPAGSARLGRADGAGERLGFLRSSGLPDASGNGVRRTVVARPRHQPAGKLLRPLCGQPCRRARHDAADDRHRARAGRRRWAWASTAPG